MYICNDYDGTSGGAAESSTSQVNHITHAQMEIHVYIISTVTTDGLAPKAVSTMLIVWYAVQNQKLKLYFEEK